LAWRGWILQQAGQATVPGSPRQQGKLQKRQQNRINDSYIDEEEVDDLVREAGKVKGK
jgi:hypothetical protein